MHINEMLNKKTYIGNIEPNPKEFGIWIKEDGTHMIYDYTNNQWVCECSGSSKVLYYKVAAGVGVREFISNVAGLKIFDAIDNRFEYIPSYYVIEQDIFQGIAPNFSFDTDEYCIAYLPINAMMLSSNGEVIRAVASTLEDLFVLLTGQEMPAGITRITEEEYWDDSVPTQFVIMAHTRDEDIPYTFKYEKGMTWDDWFNSKYNYIPFKRYENDPTPLISMWTDRSVPIWGDYIYGFGLNTEDINVLWDDKIENKTYYINIIG